MLAVQQTDYAVQMAAAVDVAGYHLAPAAQLRRTATGEPITRGVHHHPRTAAQLVKYQIAGLTLIINIL